jgi:hypothetical protein
LPKIAEIAQTPKLKTGLGKILGIMAILAILAI